jgi:hypothetical protein
LGQKRRKEEGGGQREGGRESRLLREKLSTDCDVSRSFRLIISDKYHHRRERRERTGTGEGKEEGTGQVGLNNKDVNRRDSREIFSLALGSVLSLIQSITARRLSTLLFGYLSDASFEERVNRSPLDYADKHISITVIPTERNAKERERKRRGCQVP